jgi:CO/xanthine dehydrogenase FAD-binding subunit
MAVAMRVLDANGGNRAPDGQRRVIPIADFHRLPGDTPHIDTNLERGELITAVTLPRPVGGTHIYRKVRDRASYAFALVSVAGHRAARRHRPRRAGRRGAQALARVEAPRPPCRKARAP